ncbi:TPA: large conductance mechanosensitive channel protein MscL [Candidatus Taylorbacteria bacterium]|nr:large conductance mechanosensitive channel protein MscL [Candidatus Taylorbacteria bacterium]
MIQSLRNFLNEFKNFALRGNVIDLAIGIIVGAGFNQVVNSLVTNIILPPIGLLLGQVDFSTLFINLGFTKYQTLAEAQKVGAPTLNYGLFISSLISFIITAFVVFLMIRWITKLQRRGDKGSKAPTTKQCPLCFTNIDIRATRCPACTAAL